MAREWLEPWWQQLEPDCAFRRTPGSGGWTDPKTRGEFKASGDVMTTAKRFPFAVEVKRREDWSLTNLVNGHKCPAWAWWRQAIEEAGEMGKLPMLWLKKNRRPWLVLVPDLQMRSALSALEVDISWAGCERELAYRGVETGGVLPCGLLAKRLVQVPPASLAGLPGLPPQPGQRPP